MLVVLSSCGVIASESTLPSPVVSINPKVIVFCTVPSLITIPTSPASVLPLYAPSEIPADVSPFSFCASMKFEYVHCDATNLVSVPVTAFAVSNAESAAACVVLLSN